MSEAAIEARAGRRPARGLWGSLSLTTQFVSAGLAVLVAGMAVIGLWVSKQIEEGVISNTGVTTALYIDSVLSPLLADIETDGIGAGAHRALDEALTAGELGTRLAAFKIWLPGGTVAYSSDDSIIGLSFPPTDSLLRAFTGEVAAEFDQLDDAESRNEVATGLPLLEIYAPLREPWSGRIVAVAEFYEVATELQSTLASARTQSWIVVGLVTLGMIGLLSGIVAGGNALIKSQRRRLEDQVGQLTRLLDQNEDLRRSVQSASERSVALNERVLRRTSADLHDGPVQLLALAAMRLGADTSPEERGRIKGFIDDALVEIRAICTDLALPEIERLPLSRLLQAAAAAHEARTGHAVTLALDGADLRLGHAEKIGVYRFVQEALNNASRHAGGVGLAVAAAVDAHGLEVTVSDAGPGFDPDAVRGSSLGLAGLRERAASLGGTLAIDSGTAGTTLTFRLNAPETRG